MSLNIEKKIFERLFWRFCTIRSLMPRTKATILHLNTAGPVLFSKWLPDGGIRACSGYGIQVWKWSEKKVTSWKFQTVRTLIQASQIDNSPIKNLFTTRIFSMPTLIAKIKPVVLVKYELEYREKLKVKCFGPSGYWCKREKQWFFSWMLVYKCCPESDARIKTKSLLIESSSTKNGKCSMETLVGGIIPVVPEKYEFDYRKKTIIFNIS